MKSFKDHCCVIEKTRLGPNEADAHTKKIKTHILPELEMWFEPGTEFPFTCWSRRNRHGLDRSAFCPQKNGTRGIRVQALKYATTYKATLYMVRCFLACWEGNVGTPDTEKCPELRVLLLIFKGFPVEGP